VISRLTKILREEVVACLAELDRSSFIAKKNLWKFKHYEITERSCCADNVEEFYRKENGRFQFLEGAGGTSLHIKFPSIF